MTAKSKPSADRQQELARLFRSALVIPVLTIERLDDAVPLERVDPAAAHAEREAALVRQRELTPQTAEYAREQAIVDFADAKLALARSGV